MKKWFTQSNPAESPWFFRSRLRLFSTLFVTLAVPTALFLLFVSLAVRQQLFQDLAEDTRLLTGLIARQIDEEFFGLRRYVESFARRPDMRQAAEEQDLAELQRLMREMVLQNPRVSRAIVTDAAGQLLYGFPFDPAVTTQDLSGSDWFRGAARTGETYVSVVYPRVALDRSNVVAIARRIEPVNGAGGSVGFIAAQYSVAELGAWLRRITPRELGFVAVADQSLNIIHDEFEVMEQVAAMNVPCADSPDDNDEQAIAQRIWIPALEAEYYAGCVRVPALGWTAVVLTPAAQVYEPVTQVQRAILLIFALLLALLLLIGMMWFETVYNYAEGLRRSTAELEHFCYNIAHNFRSPIRSMEGFATLLLEDCKEQQSGPVTEYAGRIKAAAAQMDELVHDFLQYGRTAHVDLKIETISLNSVVSRALEHLEPEILRASAKVEIASELPDVRADRHILDHIVLELLTNALKFSRPGVAPEVSVSHDRMGSFVRLWVRDRGIGISPRFHQQIFEVFHRLHAGSELPGTGIGLAVVRKGVERMNGRCGVVSDEGKGSAFWVDLPRG